MADRLQELLQQRALIKEHLAWLESEIAAASGGRPASSFAPEPTLQPRVEPALARPAIAPSALLRSSAPIGVKTAADAEADALLAKFAEEERQTVAPPDKKGCWVLFSTLLAISTLIAVALIYFFYR
jgi:hypothetical protein